MFARWRRFSATIERNAQINVQITSFANGFVLQRMNFMFNSESSKCRYFAGDSLTTRQHPAS
jgi:hypothetical protein